MLTNPSVIAMVVGHGCFLISWEPPQIVMNALNNLGSLNTGLVMLVLGANLAQCQFASLVHDAAVWKACVLRLVAMPLLTLATLFLLPRTGPADVWARYERRHEQYAIIDAMCGGGYPHNMDKVLRGFGAKIHMEPGDKELLAAYPLDFVSFSYYRSSLIADGDGVHLLGGATNSYCDEKTPWGWAIDPLGLHLCLNELYDRYHKPLFVIENGMGAIDKLEEDGSVHDGYRIDYLSKHLSAIRDAICIDHVDCIGYTMWGNVDLVSRSTGEMTKRYGFVYVDMDDKGSGTLRRSRKDSFYWFKRVCESNGTDLGA